MYHLLRQPGSQTNPRKNRPHTTMKNQISDGSILQDQVIFHTLNFRSPQVSEWEAKQHLKLKRRVLFGCEVFFNEISWSEVRTTWIAALFGQQCKNPNNSAVFNTYNSAHENKTVDLRKTFCKNILTCCQAPEYRSKQTSRLRYPHFPTKPFALPHQQC